MADELTVENDRQARLYDVHRGDRIVGSVIYELRGSRAVISHTVVDPAERGKGVATALVKGALDDIRGNGWTITNYCSFISGFIIKHPEYADLIDSAIPGFDYRP